MAIGTVTIIHIIYTNNVKININNANIKGIQIGQVIVNRIINKNFNIFDYNKVELGYHHEYQQDQYY